MGDSEHGRRVALVANTSFFLGPALARQLAARGHDLVVGDPQEGLVDELEAAGSSVEVVTGLGDLTEAGAADRLVEGGAVALRADRRGGGLHGDERRGPVRQLDDR
jgi:NAD(P)-dependent dehydrogenase (short-subunit alcohol dehydrogenase family)